jgi:hypothetical protein
MMGYRDCDVQIGNDYASRKYCDLARLSPRIEKRFLTVGVNALRHLTFRSDSAGVF